jgi:hypothetical protein
LRAGEFCGKPSGARYLCWSNRSTLAIGFDG